MSYVIDGVQLTEGQARRIAKQVADRDTQRPQPVPKQVYRRKEASDAEPFNGYALLRYNGGSSWSSQSAGQSWESSWWDHENCTKAVQRGDWVPYVPPAPTFAVDDWVMPVQGYSDKALQVTGIDHTRPCDESVQITAHEGNTRHTAWKRPSKLRHATPEEIAAAKRIEPKPDLIIASEPDVWQLAYQGSISGHWTLWRLI